MNNQPFNNDKKIYWAPLKEFIIHTIVGMATFLIIASFTVGMNYVRERLILDGFVATGLKSAEVIILALDSLLILVFTIRTTVSFFSKMLTSLRGRKNGSR